MERVNVLPRNTLETNISIIREDNEEGKRCADIEV